MRAKNPIANFLEITEEGRYLWQYGVLPVCTGEGEVFDVFYHRPEIEYTNEPSGSQQYCEDFVGETDIELNERGDGCVKFYLIDSNVIECDVGTLNEQSGMCEIRLGSGANKKASLIFSFSFFFFHHDFEPLCKMRVT